MGRKWLGMWRRENDVDGKAEGWPDRCSFGKIIDIPDDSPRTTEANSRPISRLGHIGFPHALLAARPPTASSATVKVQMGITPRPFQHSPFNKPTEPSEIGAVSFRLTKGIHTNDA